MSNAGSDWGYSVSGSPKQGIVFPSFSCLYSCATNSASLFRGSKQHELCETMGAVVAAALSSRDQALSWVIQRAELAEN